MSEPSARDVEIERNFRAFQARESAFPPSQNGKYALMHDGEVIGVYDTLADAHQTGERFYRDQVYSIQRIGRKPIGLGYFSHAVHLG
jgi:hypothetical protein